LLENKEGNVLVLPFLKLLTKNVKLLYFCCVYDFFEEVLLYSVANKKQPKLFWPKTFLGLFTRDIIVTLEF